MRNAVMVGERVYLRPFEQADAAVLSEASIDERSSMMKRGRIPFSVLAFEVDANTGPAAAPPATIVFIVARKDDDRVLGNVLLLDVDWLNRTAETASYLISEEVRGKGYGTEAKMLLLEYAFDRIHLHALQSWVSEVNPRSQAALAKQGYRRCGVYHWTDLKRGEYTSHYIYDLLREDWIAARDAWKAALALRGEAGDD